MVNKKPRAGLTGRASATLDQWDLAAALAALAFALRAFAFGHVVLLWEKAPLGGTGPKFDGPRVSVPSGGGAMSAERQ